jgi:hypothetical protein
MARLAREWLDRAVGDEALTLDRRVLVAAAFAQIAQAEAAERLADLIEQRFPRPPDVTARAHPRPY